MEIQPCPKYFDSEINLFFSNRYASFLKCISTKVVLRILGILELNL